MMQANPSTRSLQAIIHNLPKRFEACGFKNFVADEDQLKIYADICLKFSKNPKRKSLVMFGNVGSGKCYGKGTKIILANGKLKNVEDLRVGESLMGIDSKPNKIISLGRGYENLYEIICNKGSRFVANESHILTLQKTPTTQDPNRVIKNITIKEYLITNPTFKKNHRLMYSDGINFNYQNVPIDPYYVGLWLGDGDKTNTRITNIDNEIIDYLRFYAKEINHELRTYKYGDKCSSYAIVEKRGKSSKNNLRLNLKKIGLLNNDKHIPDIYKYNNEEVRLNLLAGLIDSDGHKDNKEYEIITKYKDLAKDIVYLAKSLGFQVSIRKKQAICYNNKKSTFVDRIIIYGDCHKIPVKVNRKKIIGKRLQKKSHLVTSFEIKLLGFGKYFGFTLERNPYHLLDSFLIMHNTHLAVAILRNLPPVKQNAALYPSRPTESIFLVADEFFAEMNQAATTQKMDKNDVISKYFKNFDVILLDELRVKNFTEAKRENLYLFVNRAYLNEKSIIITTNFTPEQLEKVDEPTVSRLNEMADGFLLFTGKDFRLRTKQ